MPLPVDRATTLKQAFQICDVGPLKGADLERYYVDLSEVRSKESILGISTRLDFLEPGQFDTLLFTGHRGCGKSTELRRLQRHWESQYRVIYLESDNEIDINDADYTDLYLLLIKQVTDDLTKLKLQFDHHLLNSFESWFKEITEETEESVEKSISLETSAEAGLEIPFISKLLAKLLAQMKGSSKQRQTIRQTLRQDIGRLKTDINRLLKDADAKLKQKDPQQYQKGFLVIFDNLDRVPPQIGDRLYFDYAAQLEDLCCTLIYTVPISVVYSDKNLNNAFGRPNIVPMVDIYTDDRQSRDLKFSKVAVEELTGLVAQRIDIAAIFASVELVWMLVQASGGHMRQLMQMTATACLTAATRGHAKVEREDVIYAVKQEQFNFERVIPSHHYPILVEVCQSKRIEQNEDGQKMLFNTSVLEYDGNRRWNYVNPVVKQTDAFKHALQQVTTPDNA